MMEGSDAVRLWVDGLEEFMMKGLEGKVGVIRAVPVLRCCTSYLHIHFFSSLAIVEGWELLECVLLFPRYFPASPFPRIL